MYFPSYPETETAHHLGFSVENVALRISRDELGSRLHH
jgi:hypothetical protein